MTMPGQYVNSRRHPIISSIYGIQALAYSAMVVPVMDVETNIMLPNGGDIPAMVRFRERTSPLSYNRSAY